jgi:uncharacterized protein with PIN domain
MNKVVLTEKSKGFVIDKEECPNCKAEFFFKIKEKELIEVKGYAKKKSEKVISCKICNSEYDYEIKGFGGRVSL